MSLNNPPIGIGYTDMSELRIAVNIYFEYFFHFLIPTHRFGFIETSITTGLSNFIDFLSRIFIGFGIYQTIQAFRKFGRK